jgi:hypothetical protein
MVQLKVETVWRHPATTLGIEWLLVLGISA